MNPVLISSRIRQATQGMAVASIAGATRLSTHQIRKSLNSQPTLDTVCALCDGLGIRADWVLFGDGKPTQDAQRKHTIESLTPHEACCSLGSAIRRISDRADNLADRIDRLQFVCENELVVSH